MNPHSACEDGPLEIRSTYSLQGRLPKRLSTSGLPSARTLARVSRTMPGGPPESQSRLAARCVVEDELAQSRSKSPFTLSSSSRACLAAIVTG
jgi:hypothetical protein